MISEQEFERLGRNISRNYPTTGFVLVMFDPAKTHQDVLCSSNIHPMEARLETLRNYVRLHGEPLNSK